MYQLIQSNLLISFRSANLSSNFGLAINPWSEDTKDGAYVPGGSSGGSAIAVAANTCYGYSILVPFSLLKPAKLPCLLLVHWAQIQEGV